MKAVIFCLLAAAAYVCASPAVITLNAHEPDSKWTPKKCAKGPVYWCQDIRSAHDCGATRHCIQTVWEHMHPAPDNDDVCSICKEMVGEARSQLESNETQEELKEVFEGSCRLIPIKIVAKECIQAVDEFIPELIEFLASQMDPQVVCSVAGLCDSARIDRLIAALDKETKKIAPAKKTDNKEPDNCQTCWDFVSQQSQLLGSTNRDQVLDYFLDICGHIGSLSDGCRVAVTDNFEEIYSVVTSKLSPKDTCSFTRMCLPSSSRHDMSPVQANLKENLRPLVDSETCDFCKQMVKHLRNLLVSNTTEQEFYQILKGLCGQMGKFKDQCDSLVDEYYKGLYNYLVNELDPDEICTIVGLCSVTKAQKGPIWYLRPTTDKSTSIPQVKIGPSEHFAGDDESTLIPQVKIQPSMRLAGDDESASFTLIKQVEIQPSMKIAGNDEANSIVHHGSSGLVRVPLQKVEINVHPSGNELDAASFQLPPERMMPNALLIPGLLLGDNTACVMCQYAMHYLQDQLKNPSTDEEIKQAVEQMCHHLPDTIEAQCVDFVKTYGDVIITLLVQEIDPSQVCPELGLCPKTTTTTTTEKSEIAELESTVTPSHQNKVTCVLCEYAIHRLEEYLENNHTEEAVKSELDKLCHHLGSLEKDCDVFVNEYFEEIVEMIMAEFTPEEVCVALKLCEVPGKTSSAENPDKTSGTESNNIPPVDVEILKDNSPQCVMCEFAMAELEKILGDKSTTAEIEAAVKNLCSYLPKTVRDPCRKFVDEYGDMIIHLLEMELKPNVICTELGLCYGAVPIAKAGGALAAKSSAEKCSLCQTVVNLLDELLEDSEFEDDFDSVMKKVCTYLPAADRPTCQDLVDMYGPYILGLLAELADKEKVCQALELCPKPPGQVQLLGGNKCTWGPSYWCKSSFHANACKAVKHCRDHVWKDVAPKI